MKGKKDLNKCIQKYLYLFTVLYICPFISPLSSASQHTKLTSYLDTLNNVDLSYLGIVASW